MERTQEGKEKDAGKVLVKGVEGMRNRR